MSLEVGVQDSYSGLAAVSSAASELYAPSQTEFDLGTTVDYCWTCGCGVWSSTVSGGHKLLMDRNQREQEVQAEQNRSQYGSGEGQFPTAVTPMDGGFGLGERVDLTHGAPHVNYDILNASGKQDNDATRLALGKINNPDQQHEKKLWEK